MPDDAITEWSDLEDAVLRQDWGAASRFAEEFDVQWREVRAIVEVFAGPDAEGWSKVIDDALEALTAALSVSPVVVSAVEQATSRLRELLGEYGPKSRA